MLADLRADVGPEGQGAAADLFSGVEIRWKSAIEDGETPTEATFHFPGGLSDYLTETLGGSSTYAERPFAGTVDFKEKFNTPGKVEWAINWTPSRDGFIQSYCNTVPTPEGGTHEAGFWAAILKGIRAYGELVNNKKASQITRDDLITGGCALVSCFIREPEFVGQTKDRLATTEAQRLVEGAVRDHFDNWLAADTKSAGAILDFLVLRAEERLRRRQEKETARKSATKKLRLPGKLTDCTNKNREGTELFIVEGDSAGGSAKGARFRETQALLPLKGKILNVLGAASNKLTSNAEIRDLCEALGVGLGGVELEHQLSLGGTSADGDGSAASAASTASAVPRTLAHEMVVTVTHELAHLLERGGGLITSIKGGIVPFPISNTPLHATTSGVYFPPENASHFPI